MSRGAARAALLAVALAASCSGDDAGSAPSAAAAPTTAAGTSTSTTTTAAPPAGDATFPGEEWEAVDPGDAGFDPAALERLAAAAEAGRSQCLAVVRDGRLVLDRSWPGPEAQPREVFSVTKSLTSVLVGIAVTRGELALDDPVATYVDAWAGTPSAGVTVEHLLSGTSGRHWDPGTDYGQMALGAEDKTAFAVGLGQDAPPGTVWAYNNSAIQVLSAVLEAATGVHPSEYAARHLFEPIGMADSSLGTDGAGGAMTFMGLSSTCTDLARLGHLALHDGTWDGAEVVDADYVRRSRTSSSDLNAAYGWLWWLNQPGTIVGTGLATSGTGSQEPTEGQLLPSAPASTFWALGFNGQVVAVVPEEGIVAVRLGPKPPDEAPFGFQALTAGVLDALVER